MIDRQLDMGRSTRSTCPRQRLMPTTLLHPAAGSVGARAAFLCMLFVVTGSLLIDPAFVFAQESASQRTMFDNVISGGVVGFVIILCSFAGVALAVTFFMQIRHDVLIPPEAQEHVQELLDRSDFRGAMEFCEEDDSFYSRVLAPGLSRVDEGVDSMRDAIQETGDFEGSKLRQKIGYLALIASVTPMLGLFGTVKGMIGTFNTIADADTQPKPAQLADGIGEALMTTFLGLLVAIPMLVLHYFFRNRLANILFEAGVLMDDMTRALKGQRRGA